jgi:hypothetical protein
LSNHEAKDNRSSREEQLSCYLDGQLSPRESDAFEAELAQNPALREELESWKRMRHRLRDAVHAASVPAQLEAKVRARTTGPGFGLFSLAPFWRPAAVMALCVVLLGSAWLMMRERVYTLADFPPAVAAMLEIGVGKHVSCVKDRVNASFLPLGSYQGDLPAPYKEMVEAARRALPSDFKVVEIHMCGTEGREFAHLTLSRGDGYLSVLLTERREGDPIPADNRTATATVGNVALYAVDRDGMEVGVFTLPQQYAFVVSEYGRQQNIEFTKSVAAAIQ